MCPVDPVAPVEPVAPVVPVCPVSPVKPRGPNNATYAFKFHDALFPDKFFIVILKYEFPYELGDTDNIS